MPCQYRRRLKCVYSTQSLSLENIANYYKVGSIIAKKQCGSLHYYIHL